MLNKRSIKLSKGISMQKFLLLYAFFLITRLQAQVHVEFSAINEYLFNPKEALNLVIINSNTKSFPVYIEGKILDANGEKITEYKSAEVLLNVGANIITPVNTALTDINYFNNDIAEIETRTGSYPSGNYTVCVWVTCVTGDCSGAGRNAAGMEQAVCLPVHIENPTPLMLATPENDSEIEEKRPLFTWIPPSPVAGSSGLNYTMVLVEILEGQNKADALSQNRPLIEAEGLGNPALMFPSDVAELEPGKTYAWQVEACVGKTPIAKSEQWKFKIRKTEEKKDTFRYAKLSSEPSTSFYTIPVSSPLFISYEGAYSHSELAFSVMDDQNKPLQSIDKIIKTELFRPGDDSLKLVSFGDNKYILDLGQLPLDIGRYYNFIVMDGLSRKFYLRIFTVPDKK